MQAVMHHHMVMVLGIMKGFELCPQQTHGMWVPNKLMFTTHHTQLLQSSRCSAEQKKEKQVVLAEGVNGSVQYEPTVGIVHCDC
jgi:hypothetical protein